MKKCVIIAGSPDADINFIKRTVTDKAYVICADKGYTYAKAAEIVPNMIIGDFDSCADELPNDIERITLQREKQFTDTVHCIDNALKKGYDEITILGATGGRLDHCLGNIYALEYLAHRGGRGVILSEAEQVELLTEGRHEFREMDGLTFSLFPFGCERACVSIEGAHYPLEKYTMLSCRPVGVSNIFEGEQGIITVHSGKTVVIINRKKICGQ